MEGNLHSQSIGLAFFLERNLLFFCFTLYYGTIFFFGGAYTWRGGLIFRISRYLCCLLHSRTSGVQIRIANM